MSDFFAPPQTKTYNFPEGFPESGVVISPGIFWKTVGVAP